MREKVKYAMFGGSFDPPHLGHKEIIKRVLELKDVDRVLVVPTYLNPFKSSFSADAELRLEWVKKSFNFDSVEFSSFEIEQNRAVYTVETFKEISKERDIRYIVIGADNLESLSKWREFEYLNSKIIWIIATRVGQSIDCSLLRESVVIKVDIDISSTSIRSCNFLDMVDKKIQKQVALEYNCKKV